MKEPDASPWWSPERHADRRPFLLARSRIASAIRGWFEGQEFLETAMVHVHLPWIGDVKLVSAAIFDFGVYLLVIGVVIIVLGNLASRTHAAGPEVAT